jgi:hypothetical protein
MQNVNYRKLVANSFDKLHEQISSLRSLVEAMDDPVARRHLESMEYGLLAPMRKLRIHMAIPYDWHEEKAEAKGATK